MTECYGVDGWYNNASTADEARLGILAYLRGTERRGTDTDPKEDIPAQLAGIGKCSCYIVWGAKSIWPFLLGDIQGRTW
jgi:hypothetical protein